MARAKAIAPEGPAPLSKSRSFQSSGRAPHASTDTTTTGMSSNLIPATAATFFVGQRLCPDKITPRAKSVRGAAPAPANLQATKSGSAAITPKPLLPRPKAIAIKTGFFTKRSRLCPADCPRLASKSVVIMKKAKVTVASQTTAAMIGILPPLP